MFVFRFDPSGGVAMLAMYADNNAVVDAKVITESRPALREIHAEQKSAPSNANASSGANGMLSANDFAPMNEFVVFSYVCSDGVWKIKPGSGVVMNIGDLIDYC